MRLADLVRAATSRLQAAELAFGHGTTDATDEAAWLVLWALGLPLDTNWQAAGDRPVTDAERERAEALIERRITERVPAAYLTREAWLQGVPFYIDERSIVPRSFLAEMIAAAPGADCLDDWLDPLTTRVLDMCCGNGSLAVLAALAWPDVQVDAVDLSVQALEVAHINVERHGLGERIRLMRSDGWAALGGQRYDLVLCNPPYVSQASMDRLPAEYRAEPVLALAGGRDGMDFIRAFLASAADHLSDHGLIALEIGNEREHFEQAFPTLPVEWPTTSAGIGAVTLITRAGLLAAGLEVAR